MTKTQEIALIREFAEKLGPNSYFGPVLKDQLADIEQAIQNDLYPETMASTLIAKNMARARLKEALEALG